MKNDELNNILDASFRNEPDYQLPTDFAQKVTLAVVKREQWKTDLSDYFYLMVCLVLLIVVATGIYYLADKELLVRTLAFLKRNIFPVLFMGFILSFILLADRVLLRLLFYRWKSN
jgi:hypothetical protein